MDSVQLEILDMNCKGCAAGLQMVTEKLDGVHSAMIDLEGKCGTWEVDFSRVSVEDIINEIKKLGYTARPVSV